LQQPETDIFLSFSRVLQEGQLVIGCPTGLFQVVTHLVVFQFATYFNIGVFQKNTNDILFFFAVLGLELRAYTLSHSTSPFVLGNYLPWLASNHDPPDLCLLNT
jgi:hypothetical protein